MDRPSEVMLSDTRIYEIVSICAWSPKRSMDAINDLLAERAELLAEVARLKGKHKDAMSVALGVYACYERTITGQDDHRPPAYRPQRQLDHFREFIKPEFEHELGLKGAKTDD